MTTARLNWQDPTSIYYDLRYTYVKETPPGSGNYIPFPEEW